jgi:hypothetical protein
MQEPPTSNLDHNDIDASFPTVGDPTDLLRSKLQLANYRRDWTFNPENILRRLRFLSVPVATNGASPPAITSPLAAAATCDKCVGYPSFDDGRIHSDNRDPAQMRILRLTNPGDLADCIHYVAISYCWQQPRASLGDETPAMNHVIMDGDNQRMSRVSPNIIRRAIDFAMQKDLRLIWIDQECIDQDDPQDKALHIQAMHLIFRRAQYVAAILNNALTEQWHVDILSRDNHATLLDHASLTRLAKVAQWLASDIWYNVIHPEAGQPFALLSR